MFYLFPIQSIPKHDVGNWYVDSCPYHLGGDRIVKYWNPAGNCLSLSLVGYPWTERPPRTMPKLLGGSLLVSGALVAVYIDETLIKLVYLFMLFYWGEEHVRSNYEFLPTNVGKIMS